MNIIRHININLKNYNFFPLPDTETSRIVFMNANDSIIFVGNWSGHYVYFLVHFGWQTESYGTVLDILCIVLFSRLLWLWLWLAMARVRPLSLVVIDRGGLWWRILRVFVLFLFCHYASAVHVHVHEFDGVWWSLMEFEVEFDGVWWSDVMWCDEWCDVKATIESGSLIFNLSSHLTGR